MMLKLNHRAPSLLLRVGLFVVGLLAACSNSNSNGSNGAAAGPGPSFMVEAAAHSSHSDTATATASSAAFLKGRNVVLKGSRSHSQQHPQHQARGRVLKDDEDDKDDKEDSEDDKEDDKDDKEDDEDDNEDGEDGEDDDDDDTTDGLLAEIIALLEPILVFFIELLGLGGGGDDDPETV